MTYQELLEAIQEEADKNPEILLQDATVYDSENDEYYPLSFTDLTESKTCIELDPGHLILGY
jgi:hypothetical protein